MINGIIFDMDGVLFDTERLNQDIWLSLGEQFGIKLAKEHMALLRGGNFENGEKVFKGIFGDDFDFAAMHKEAHRILDEKLAVQVPVKQGVRELLPYLDKLDYPMAVASSSPKERVLQNLAATDTAQYFTAVICGDMVTHSKPHPDIFLRAAAALGQAPKECMAIEDSYNGVRSAAAAGMHTVMVPDLDMPTAETALLCQYQLQRLLDIKKILQM